jgi:hypothetical protein
MNNYYVTPDTVPYSGYFSVTVTEKGTHSHPIVA